MQRLKVLGGRLSGTQWRVLGQIVRLYTPQTPLHLTTRQDVEIHNLTAEEVPHVQRMIDEAGLSCLGACGDTLRNVTCCPENGLVADTFDERDDAVKALLAMTISACKKRGKYVGICGQGPSDHPDLARWLLDQGIESMSLNPDTVIETWMFLAGEVV